MGGAAAAAVLWRLFAQMAPSAMITIPDSLRLPFALLGLLHIACALWAWGVRPGRFTAVFLIFGLGGGVHWGGAIGASSDAIELGLLLVYVGLAAAFDASLLHLALIYPRGAGRGAWWIPALYAPAAAGLLLAGLAWVMSTSVLETTIGLLLMVGNFMGMAAGVIFLVRLLTAGHALRRAARLGTIAAGVLAGGGLAMAGTAGYLPGGPAEAWNLALGLVPLSLAAALVRESVTASPSPAMAESAND